MCMIIYPYLAFSYKRYSIISINNVCSIFT